MYQIDLIANYRDFIKIEPRWNHLLSRAAPVSIFQTYEWHAAWWRAVGAYDPNIHMHVLLIRDERGDCGIGPFMIYEGERGRTLTFLSAPYADYHGMVLAPESMERAIEVTLRYLKSESGGWDRIELPEIPERSPLLGLAEAVLRKLGDKAANVEPGRVCPGLDLADDRFLAEILNRREHIVKARRLSRMGNLTCHHYFDPEAIKRIFPSFKAMHSSQWNHRPDAIATFDDPNLERFFVGLIDTMGRKGWIMLTELSLDDAPLSYYYSFAYEKIYFAYRTCFDTKMRRYSPGHIMLKSILQYLKEQGYTRFDLMRGGYQYKYNYSNQESRNYAILAE
jgi:CelD/BcsL family acetyltransferase involved in cellulose biosynthesis